MTINPVNPPDRRAADGQLVPPTPEFRAVHRVRTGGVEGVVFERPHLDDQHPLKFGVAFARVGEMADDSPLIPRDDLMALAALVNDLYLRICTQQGLTAVGQRPDKA